MLWKIKQMLNLTPYIQARCLFIYLCTQHTHTLHSTTQIRPRQLEVHHTTPKTLDPDTPYKLQGLSAKPNSAQQQTLIQGICAFFRISDLGNSPIESLDKVWEIYPYVSLTRTPSEVRVWGAQIFKEFRVPGAHGL